MAWVAPAIAFPAGNTQALWMVPTLMPGAARYRQPLRFVCALLTLTLAAGCASRSSPPPDLPPLPGAFREAATRSADAPAAAAPADGAWWKVFGDPVLDDLIGTALRSNNSIQIAAANLAKARALLGTAEANRLPQANLAAGGSRQGGPLINAAGGRGTLWTLSANASYELDVFGKLKQEASAASLDVAAREALLQSARLMVQADVAQTYFGLRLLDADRALMRDTLAAYRETLRLSQHRLQLGSISELDVARLRLDAATAEAELLALERRRAEMEHGLALLQGQVATRFNLEPAAPDGRTLALPVIPAGIPGDVLARRPDVAAAQRSMLAAQARLGVARTAWFPSFTLAAGQGFASNDLRDLIAVAARAYSVSALLAMPLLDGGRRKAAIDGAGAELTSSIASYREQILVAVKEVEDQLSSLRLLAGQAGMQAEAVTAASRAAALAQSRYQSGLASQLEWLDAQRAELRNRRQALQVSLSQYQSTVGLIRALGGGWDAAQADRVTLNTRSSR